MMSRYIPAIDGLRAVAVLLVILFHTHVAFAGWSGVWVFFVISGFVIATSLIGSERLPRPLGASLRDFYSKRAFRILPLYALAVGGGSLFNALTGVLHGQDWLQLLALSTFSFNFLPMWSDFLPSGVTSHLWSVSAEQQFYLVFPVLFLLLSRKVLVIVLSGAVVGCLLLRWGVSTSIADFVPGNPKILPDVFRGAVIYHFSLLHFDAFAMGALIALSRDLIVRWRGLFVGLLTITLIGWATFFFVCGSHAAFPSPLTALMINAYGGGVEVFRYSLINLSATVVIIGILKGVWPLQMLLGLRPIVYIGKISFGVYIFHYPVVFFLSSTLFTSSEYPLDQRLLMFAATVGLTVPIAMASFHWFEKPVQGLRSRRKSGAS
jgi:peptidoglycan/LPS O-acetylase OafA/YrhL